MSSVVHNAGGSSLPAENLDTEMKAESVHHRVVTVFYLIYMPQPPSRGAEQCFLVGIFILVIVLVSSTKIL